VVVSDVQEREAGPPEEVALENARRKAQAVWEREPGERELRAHKPGARVLGVDTVVALESRLYGKPADRVQAEETLRALSGRRHVVISGICLIDGDRTTTASVRTGVRFRTLDDTTLGWYLDSEEWRERAGGYAIQGRGAALVAAIEGDYLNVVGLSVSALLELAPDLLRG